MNFREKNFLEHTTCADVACSDDSQISFPIRIFRKLYGSYGKLYITARKRFKADVERDKVILMLFFIYLRGYLSNKNLNYKTN